VTKLAHKLVRQTLRALHGTPIHVLVSAFALQQLQTRADVRVAKRTVSACAPENVAFGEERSALSSEPDPAKIPGTQEHVREAWVNAEARHLPPVRCDDAGSVNRAKPRKEITGASEHGIRRRIEPT